VTFNIDIYLQPIKTPPHIFHTTTQNKHHQNMSNKWFKKAVESDSEEESDDEVSSDEEEKPTAVSGKGWFGKKPITSDSEEESDEEENSDEEEEEAEGDEADKPQISEEEKRLQEKRNKWMKNSDDESDSSDEDSDEDDDDDEDKANKPSKRSRFLASDSEDEDDGKPKGVIRSAKEKALDSLSEQMFKLSTKISANAWTDIGGSLVELQKVVDKVHKLKLAQYNTSGYLPKSFIKFAAELEDSAERAFLNKKKLPINEAKILGSLRGKLRKQNAEIRTQINDYRRDPDAYVDDDEDAEEEQDNKEKSWFDQSEEQQQASVSDKTDEWNEAPTKKKETKKTNVWMKDDEDDKKKLTAAKKPKKPTATGERKPKKAATGSKIQKVERVITELNLEERLQEMRSERGYRGTVPADQLIELEKYLKICESPDKTLSVLFMIIGTLFDVPPTSASFLPVDIWKVAISSFTRVIHLLETDKQQEQPKLDFPQLVTLYERLDDEFIKSLQFIDPHTQDYVTRLKDEILIVDIGERVFELVEGDRTKQVSVAIRLLEHLYYRKQDDHARMFKAQRELIPQSLTEMSKTWISKSETVVPVTFSSPSVISEDLHTIMVKLSNLVFAEAAAQNTQFSQQQSVKCVLYLVYHLALRGDWDKARDLLLRTRVGELISQMVERENKDIAFMVGYNRAICQLGICAFRNGLIAEAHYLLTEISSSGKVKELLAQGAANVRHTDKAKKAEHEKAEKSRSVLYHKHINLDMLEGVHLICAMLLEVPNMAQKTATKKKTISKHFKRLIEFYHRQVFLGPPENTRDHINAAASALGIGDWKQTYQNLEALDDMWSLMIDAEAVKTMLLQTVKTEALRTYLFAFGHHYDTICIKNLASQFEMSEKVIHSLLSKLMIHEEVHAAFDQPTNTFKIFKTEPTSLQQLALQLSERAAAFVEWNEKMAEAKSQGGSLISMTKDGKEDARKKKMRQSGKSGKPTGPRQKRTGSTTNKRQQSQQPNASTPSTTTTTPAQ
jgi:translation initiation factor 3 subunit C